MEKKSEEKAEGKKREENEGSEGQGIGEEGEEERRRRRSKQRYKMRIVDCKMSDIGGEVIWGHSIVLGIFFSFM